MTPKEKLSSSSSSALADSMFKKMNASDLVVLICTLLFIAPSKHGVRLIVKREGSSDYEAVYAFPEVLEYADVKVGDTIQVLGEKRVRDGKQYCNCTALSKVE